MTATPSACHCGWKVPKNVILYSNDAERDADIEYECPECGQKHVIGVFTREASPEGRN